ncbi:MAG: hypothetical protein MJ252_20160, partial [archaeon]|nr:hypothetical protein [archaeon]
MLKNEKFLSADTIVYLSRTGKKIHLIKSCRGFKQCIAIDPIIYGDLHTLKKTFNGICDICLRMMESQNNSPDLSNFKLNLNF